MSEDVNQELKELRESIIEFYNYSYNTIEKHKTLNSDNMPMVKSTLKIMYDDIKEAVDYVIRESEKLSATTKKKN